MTGIVPDNDPDDDGPINDGWELGPEDRELLVALSEEFPRLSSLAKSGDQLFGVGEAWDAVDAVLDGRSVEVNVGLTVGFRRGDREYNEGLYLEFRISDEEIRLDELNTSYSSDFGSDHSTRIYAVLEPGGQFDESGVMEWLEKLSEILGYEDASLSVSRDHL